MGWPQQQKLGDYFHMVSDDSGAHVAWAATFNGEQDVYYGRIRNSLTSVEDQSVIASSFSLEQNYPNPFNPTTKIVFRMGLDGFVSLKVYDVLGRDVAVLVHETKTSGTHSIAFDASHLSSGVFYYRLISEGFTQTRKMLVVR
jgi:hypothetical protein